MPDFKSEILHFNLGKGVIVVSRGIALGVFGVLFIGFCYLAWFNNSVEMDDNIKVSRILASSWEEFLSDCGSSVILRNPIKAKSKF